MTAPRDNLFGRSREELQQLLGALDEPAYRARQVYEWLYRKRCRSVDEMTNLAAELRRRLAERHALHWPEVQERRLSYDGTRKYLFRLGGGATVESVMIPEGERRTICVSTQAGCPLACAFCLTGVGGYERNLSPSEILGQVAAVMADCPADQPKGAWNIVFMGMGEPLLNADATLAALRVLMDARGFAIPPRKLTLSTVGIVPALERLAAEPVRPNLAISLHAADPALRRRLMPIESKYPLAEVLELADRYRNPRGGGVTYEYVLLDGVNDSAAAARALAQLLRGRRGIVNLIPLNPADEIPFRPPAPEAVDRFCRVLVDADVRVSVRRPRGRDVLAACGQLRLPAARAGRGSAAASHSAPA